jgi:hypothetical protein
MAFSRREYFNEGNFIGGEAKIGKRRHRDIFEFIERCISLKLGDDESKGCGRWKLGSEGE